MTTTNLRNVGIIAHVDAGKTTLTERVLHLTGQIHASGEVHHGNTTTDFGVEEQKMGITISAAAVSCAWKGTTIQIIDTPGHADFTLEVERSLRVLDGAVLLIDGVAGVEAQTETVWRQARQHGVSAVAFINKLDRAGADFGSAVANLRERLPGTFVPVQLPVHDREGRFVGIVDLVGASYRRFEEGFRTARAPLPADLEGAVEMARNVLIESVAEQDEVLLERFVEGRVDRAMLRQALRRCVLRARIVPVFAGSAFQHRGVNALLDGIVHYLPSPEERGVLRDGAGELVATVREEAGVLSALCFKVTYDDHACLAFVRVYSGALRKGESFVAQGKTHRAGRIVRLFADRREEVSSLAAGEIGALLTTALRTGDTLSERDHVHALERVEAPPAVIEMALEPKTRDDRERLPKALQRLLVEDPSLRLKEHPETGQTTLAGMGPLHLEVAKSQLFTRHRVQVNLGAPRVAYRETIAHDAGLTHRHIKQSGGPGQFAVLTLRVEPFDGAFAFEDQTRGGVLSREYVRGIEKGCRSAMSHGVLGGHPLTGVRVVLLDGAMHVSDSSEHAFELAASAAFRKACERAGPVLLEPIMALEVHAPAPSGGSVIADIGARRGLVEEVEEEAGERRVGAKVPLAELFAYAGDLGSLTSGRGRHQMSLDHYAPVPAQQVRRALA